MTLNTEAFKKAKETHKVWHKFARHMEKRLGEGWEHNLVGYEAQTLIEKYAKRNTKIRIVPCDDSVHASSILVIVPHEGMGNSILFIPQCTEIKGQFFLYPNHQKRLLEALTEMQQERTATGIEASSL